MTGASEQSLIDCSKFEGDVGKVTPEHWRNCSIVCRKEQVEERSIPGSLAGEFMECNCITVSLAHIQSQSKCVS